MGKYLTPRQWENVLGGVAYKNKMTYTDELSTVKLHVAKLHMKA